MPEQRRYSLGPLLERTGWTMQHVRSIAPCGGPEYRRRYAEGVTEALADRLATAAGLHPVEVWDDWLDGAMVPCPECGRRFVPARRSHRYCTKDCYQRRYKREQYRARYATDPEFRARELEKSRRYRHEAAPAVRAKKRAYYRANRHLWVQARRRRREEEAT